MKTHLVARVRSWTATIGIVRDDLWRDGRGWLLVLVAVGWLFVLGTRFVFPALLPWLKTEFTLSNARAGLVITAIWLAYAAMQFPSGTFTDRINERSILVASVLVTTVSVLVLSLTTTFLVFFAGCVLFGLGTGLYGPPRVIVLSNTFSQRDSMAIGLTFAAGSVGSAALPFVAGVLASRFGWRSGFVVLVVPLAVIAVGLWLVIPRRTSAVTSAAEKSAHEAIDRVTTAVADPTILLAWLSISLSLFVFQGVSAFLPTYLIATKGLDVTTAATLFGVFFASGAIAQPIAGSLADRYGRGRILAVIAGFGTLPLAALPFVRGLLPLTVLSAVLGTRLGLGPINNGYIVAALPDDVQGTGYGLVRTFHMAIGSTGSIVVGTLADVDLFHEAFLGLAGISALLVVVYLRLPVLDR